MRALAITLALFTGSTALAASELQLESSMPVVLVLDGESVGTVQPIDALLVDIEPGVHNLQVKGMLGKTLYDRDLIFDDDTRTELVWQRKELRLGSVVKLDPNREQPDEGVRMADGSAPPPPAEPTSDPPAEQVAAAPPTPGPPAQPLARPAQPEASTPVATAPPAPAPAPQITAPPVVHDVSVPSPAPRASGGSVVIEATHGMDLQITHGMQKLRVTVENGELVVEDANGTEIHFPADGEAF